MATSCQLACAEACCALPCADCSCAGSPPQDVLAAGAVCEAQLKKGLKDVSAADAERIVVAYEPVWAIGTGLVATPEQAQAAHAVIRRVLGEIYGDEVARRIVIQYGGSVTPESIDELIRMPDIDGALVGGASLKTESFGRIVNFVQK